MNVEKRNGRKKKKKGKKARAHLQYASCNGAAKMMYRQRKKTLDLGRGGDYLGQGFVDFLKCIDAGFLEIGEEEAVGARGARWERAHRFAVDGLLLCCGCRFGSLGDAAEGCDLRCLGWFGLGLLGSCSGGLLAGRLGWCCCLAGLENIVEVATAAGGVGQLLGGWFLVMAGGRGEEAYVAMRTLLWCRVDDHGDCTLLRLGLGLLV